MGLTSAPVAFEDALHAVYGGVALAEDGFLDVAHVHGPPVPYGNGENPDA